MSNAIAKKLVKVIKDTYVWRVDNVPELYLENRRSPFILTSPIPYLLAVFPTWITVDGSFGLTMIFTDKLAVR